LPDTSVPYVSIIFEVGKLQVNTVLTGAACLKGFIKWVNYMQASICYASYPYNRCTGQGY